MPHPRGVLLFSPTQTGALHGEIDLEAIAEVIARHDLAVLEDRISAGTEFQDVPTAPCLAACAPEIADRRVTLGGVSRSHNLANAGVEWACGPDALVEAMRRWPIATILTVPRLPQIMALAALNARKASLDENAVECRHRVSIVRNALEAFNAELEASTGYHILHEPRAGHSLLVSMAPLRGRRWRMGTIENSVDLPRYLPREPGVAVSPAFWSGFDGCEVRLCLGSIGVAETYSGAAAAERCAVLAALDASDKRRPRSPDAPAGAVLEAGRERLGKALHERLAPVTAV